MMKRLGSLHRTLLGKILLIPLAFLTTLYILLFTPLGNRFIAPLSEKVLSSVMSTPISLHEFVLTHNRFHFILQDDKANTLSMQGGFSLLTLRLYAHYRFECFHEGGINPLSAPFKTDGAMSGGISAFDIHGNADIFDGNLLYQTQLHRFKPGNIYVKLNNIRYRSMLQMLDYPSNTDTRLFGEIDLRGLDIRDVRGSLRLNTTTRKFVSTPIAEDDNSSFDLKDLLADENGKIRPFTIRMSLEASMDNIGILEQFVGIHLGNSADINGTLEGDETRLHLNLHSSAAKSDTVFKLTLSDLEPDHLSLDVRHADVSELFSLFALPAPLKGVADVSGDFNASKGDIFLAIQKGSTLPDVLKKEYQITQPSIRFSADISAVLTPEGVHYKGSLTSDLQRLKIDSTTTHDQMLRDLLKSLH